MDFSGLPHFIYQNSARFHLHLTFCLSNPNDLDLPLNHSNPQPNTISVKLPPIFTQVFATTLLIWLTSGHGECQISSERTQRNQLRAYLKAGASYIHYIKQDDIDGLAHWCQQVWAAIRSQPPTE
jgi:hypothetical protein